MMIESAHHAPVTTQAEENGTLVHYAIPCPGITLKKFLRYAKGQARFCWEDHAHQVAYAGFGVTAELSAWGNDRFQTIQRRAKVLFQNPIICGAAPALAKPRLFGGFAFRDDFAPDNTWSVYNPADFILPHYQFTQSGDEAWLSINVQLGKDERPQDNLAQIQAALETRYRAILRFMERAEDSSEQPALASINYPMSYAVWEQKIREATDCVRSGKMEKVVLARVCEICLADLANVDIARDYLEQHYANCYRFLFEPRPYHAFYGATPELLVMVEGDRLKTMALAGSIQRGNNRQEDTQFAGQLMNDPKERHEHALVAQELAQRLQTVTRELSIPDQPHIYALSNIQHLYTPIQGRLAKSEGVLPLVELLHPTAALGGTPREAAMNFIRDAEPVPRGWYAGPVGWMDHHLDGSFNVAIRSAVSEDRRVWVYAGAGIVADSIPEKEWQETRLKFRPMLDALGIEERG